MKKAKFTMILFCTGLIFITYNNVFAGMKLRAKATKLNDKGIKTTVEKFNFYDKKYNEGGNYPNDFHDKGNGTVTDKASGLMWVQNGSEKAMSWSNAKKYLKNLNKSKYSGYKGWRFPTVEELYSILEPNPNGGIHINELFGTTVVHCWSIDTSEMLNRWGFTRSRKVTLDFKTGTAADAYTGDKFAGATAKNYYSYVKAVRSIKKQ